VICGPVDIDVFTHELTCKIQIGSCLVLDEMGICRSPDIDKHGRNKLCIGKFIIPVFHEKEIEQTISVVIGNR